MIVLRLLVLAVLALAGAATAHAQSRELTMGNVNPPKHGTSLAAQQFVDKLAELSGGKIKVVHHHSGALGGEREVAQQIQLGTVDFGPITTAPLSTLVPEMSVFQLPYIFRDYDHVFKALDGGDTLQKYYDAVLDRRGLKLVGFIAAGYRGIYGHNPINAARRRERQEGARAGGQDPGRDFQGARHDLHADRVPGSGDVAPDQGDRLRRRRGQHLLSQQVLRHRQERGRRPAHPSVRRADHVEELVPEAGRRRPESRPRGLGARASSSTASSSSTRTSRSRSRCAPRA